MNELSAGALEVVAEQGWDEDTLLTLAARFIRARGLDAAFEKWLRTVQDDEEG